MLTHGVAYNRTVVQHAGFKKLDADLSSHCGFVTTGLQVTAGVHRHSGAAPGDAQRFLEDGDAAELAHHRHADSV